MPAVVLYVEANCGDGQAKSCRQRQSLPPGVRYKNKQQIETGKDAQNNSRLQIHRRAIAWTAAGTTEIVIDSSPHLFMKRIVSAES